MNQNEKYLAEMDDDSFHSFVPSENYSDDLESLSSFEFDDETITEFDPDIKLKPNFKMPTQLAQVAASSSSTSSSSECDFEMIVKLNTPNGEVSRTRNNSTRSSNSGNYRPPLIKPLRKTVVNHYTVPDLKSNFPMPELEDFAMVDSKLEKNKQEEAKLKSSKQIGSDSNDTDALQRFAFTEIWVEGQQCRKPSMHRQFTAAMEDYFLKDKLQELTLEEQAKGAQNKQLFVDPNKPSTTNSEGFETAPEKPYVSPFAFLPTVPEGMKLPIQKSYVTVPAGYDLTNLVEYKNKNHWSRRTSTRYDSRP